MKTKKAELYSSNLIDELLNSIDPAEANRIEKRMLLAAKIDDARKAKNLNKSEFAELMDKENSVITRWLSGTHNFNSDTLFDIEEALCIKLVKIEEKPNVIVNVYTTEATNSIDDSMVPEHKELIDENFFSILYSHQIATNSTTYIAKA